MNYEELKREDIPVGTLVTVLVTPGLTPQELRVVRCMLRLGLSNEEIGRRLHMGIGTVKNYLRRVYEKAGCRNRVDLARRWKTQPLFRIGLGVMARPTAKQLDALIAGAFEGHRAAMTEAEASR